MVFDSINIPMSLSINIEGGSHQMGDAFIKPLRAKVRQQAAKAAPAIETKLKA